jgi:DNA-binding MltR family transcriptional regulator
MELNPKALDAAVKAAYDHQVGVARNAIDKSEFESGPMVNVFRRLHRESETSQVLVVSSYLEDRLVSLLQKQMRNLKSEDAKERVFGSNGPLGTFSSRITMAYHLGWLRKETVDRLNSFRKIRNIFAHQAFSVTYEDKRVKSLFVPLVKYLERFDVAVLSAMEVDKHNSLRRIHEATDAQRYLCSLSLLAGDVCRDLLILPESIRYHVSPADIAGSETQMPHVIKQLNRDMIRCALEVLAAHGPARPSA